MIDRIMKALVITIVRRQMVAGERVTGAPTAWNLAGRGSEGYARLLALAARCLEGDMPACIPCRGAWDEVPPVAEGATLRGRVPSRSLRHLSGFASGSTHINSTARHRTGTTLTGGTA